MDRDVQPVSQATHRPVELEYDTTDGRTSKALLLIVAGWLAVGVFVALFGLALKLEFRDQAVIWAMVATAAAGVMCGWRVRAVTDHPRQRRQGVILRRAAGLAIAATAIWVAAMLPPQLEAARRARCYNQLRALGQAILLYCNDQRGGRFPPGLDALVEGDYMSPELLVCPSSYDKPARGETLRQRLAEFRSGERNCSYVYVTFVQWSPLQSTPPVGAVIAYEPLHDHGNGMHVLFYDGHVEWLSKPEGTYLLSELAAGRNPPRPMSAATNRPAAKVSGPKVSGQ